MRFPAPRNTGSPAFAGDDFFDGAAPCTSYASVHLAILPRPKGIAQMAAQDLAGGVARQGFDEVDRLRRLEARDALAGEADDIRRRRLLAGLHHHDGLDRLAPFVVGHADHGDFGDIGVIADRAFDLGGIDVLAARDDHVLDAVVDIEIAVAVHVAGVAGAQPAVAVERPGG